jgi:transcriptional regulator with XRE-family HTH domain
MGLRLFSEMPRKKQPKTDFGHRLLKLRKARGFTQVELAEAAETTQRAISYYENEAGYPPAPALIALAKALGVSTDQLLGIEKPAKTEFETDPEVRRLWRKFRKVSDLPERDQRAVIRLINSLSTATQYRADAGASG